MMATILNSSILNSAILDSAILHKALTQTSSIWLKLIHSHSPWRYQPSWILPSWIQPFCTKKNFTHSIWLNLMMAAILNSAMLDSDTAILDWDTLLSSLRFTQKTLSIYSDSDSNYFNLTQTHSFSFNLMIAAILKSAILNPAILYKKNFTHSFWLKLMMAAILNSAILDSAICTKKNFTCSFWLNLMMAAILNSAILDSDTAILDLNTLLSSLRFTLKHSSSTLTLTQTNSISLT